jgi:hypothetical protein
MSAPAAAPGSALLVAWGVLLLVVLVLLLAGGGRLVVIFGPLALEIAVVLSAATLWALELWPRATTPLETALGASSVSRSRIASATGVPAPVVHVWAVQVQVFRLGKYPAFLALELDLRYARVERFVREVLFLVLLEPFERLFAVVIEEVHSKAVRFQQADASEFVLRFELSRRKETEVCNFSIA